MSRILVICEDPIGRQFAGAAMRYVELARALAKKHDVIFLAPRDGDDIPDGITLSRIPLFHTFKLGLEIKMLNPALLKEINQYDFVLSPGGLLASARLLHRIKAKLIIDLFNPSALEDLESARFQQRTFNAKGSSRTIARMLKHGDFFLCQNERQRDLYLGMMLAAGRIDSKTYDSDPSLRGLIDLVPIGLSSTPPQHNKKVLKGVCPGIALSDKVILWWGGIWNWLDPETVIHALALAGQKRGDLRLVFLGVKHPQKPVSPAVQKAVSLSASLGLFNKSAFFVDHWIPHEERGNWLLESDLGIVAHQETLETRFSWRTRVLDYLWAGLPVVTTAGDSMAELVRTEGLGRITPIGDPEKLAGAILSLLDDQNACREMKNKIEAFKPALYWENVISPLEKFISRQQ